MTPSLPLALLTLLSAAAVEPRYIFINKAPGAGWDAARPESFTREGFEEIANAVDPPDTPEMRLGVSFIFDFFRYDLDSVARSLDRFLELAEETNTPVLVNLDGMNWWEARPDLWNWWMPDAPGYDPENRLNVEWHDWGPEHALKIGWRNWGSPLRVLPVMNMASPRVIQAHQEALRVLLPHIVTWWRQLPEADKHLLGGVKLGHEAGVGVNAWYFPDGNALLDRPASEDPVYGLDFEQGWHGGMQPIGYAAVATSGLKTSGTLDREDIARVTADYLAMLCREARDAGLPQEKVYAHQGGAYKPWDKTVPWWPAFNENATPGWSFYFTDPADADGLGEALDTLGNGRWAAVEWWWHGETEAQWREHLERTFALRDCRFIAIYNWNTGFSLSQSAEGLRAVRSFMGQESSRRVNPGRGTG